MAQQNRIAGIDRLEINGQQYTWNETFAAYWSDSGELWDANKVSS